MLTMTVHRQLLVWRIRDAGSRRGPASEATTLYEDMSPPPLPHDPTLAPTVLRDQGTGRPTKKERRDTDRLLGED